MMRTGDRDGPAGNLNRDKDRNSVETSGRIIERDTLVDDDKECEQSGNEKENQVILQEVFALDYDVTEEEVLEYAHRLGIDSQSEPQLLALAKKALLTPLPSSWTPVKDSNYGIYYFNQKTGESSWTHPVDASLKFWLNKSMGGRDKAATDTDSCVDDLKTEEADSYRKNEDVLTGPLDSGTSLSNASLSSKGSPRKGALSTKEKKPTDNDSVTAEGAEKSAGEEGSVEGKEGRGATASTMDGRNARPGGLPPLGKGNGQPLPSIGKLSSFPQPLSSGEKLTSLNRPTNSLMSSFSPGSPSHSPSRLKPSEKITMSGLNLAATAPKGLSSSGVSSLSSTGYSKNSLPTSPLKSIIKRPQIGDRVRDPSPEKSLRFSLNKENPVIEFNLSDEEDSFEDDKNIGTSAQSQLRNSNFSSLKDPIDIIEKAAKLDPWRDSEKANLKKPAPINSLSTFAQEQAQIKEAAKNASAGVGKVALKPIESSKAMEPAKPIESLKPMAAARGSTPVTKSSAATTTATPTSAKTSATTLSSNSTVTAASVTPSKPSTAVNKPVTSAVAKPPQSAPSQKVEPKATVTVATTPTTTVKTTLGQSSTKTSTTTSSNSFGKGNPSPGSITAGSQEKKTPSEAQTPKNEQNVSKPPSGASVKTVSASVTPKVTTSKPTTPKVPPPKAVTPVKTNASTATPPKKIIPGSPSVNSANPTARPTPSKVMMDDDSSNSSSDEYVEKTKGKMSANGRPSSSRKASGQDMEIELEETTRQKRATNPMLRVVSKLTNKSGERAEDVSKKEYEKKSTIYQDSDEDDVYSGLKPRSGIDHDSKQEPTKCNECKRKQTKMDVSEDFLRMTRSASEEDFLRRRRDELMRQEELEAELRRKRELTLMSATLDIERSMGVLLKERQLELKREHLKSLSILKEEMESNLNEVKREAEQKEATERQQQMSRLNYFQEQYRRELETLQLGHQQSLEAMRKQNEKELDEMKAELRRYLLVHKEEFEAKLQEITLDKEMKDMLTPAARPRSTSRNSNNTMGETSGQRELRTPNPAPPERDKDKFGEMFLEELRNLRREIAEIKTTTNQPPTPAERTHEDHDCQYGSKYKDIRKRYSSLRKRIKDEKQKHRNGKMLDSISSTSSESSMKNFSEHRKFADKKLNLTNDSSTESSGDIAEEWDVTNIRVPDIADFALTKTSTPKKPTSKQLFRPRSPVITSRANGTEGVDWLTVEGNRILAQTEQLLGAIKYSDSELEKFNLQPLGTTEEDILERISRQNEKYSPFTPSLADEFESARFGQSNFLSSHDNDGNSLSSLENIGLYDVNVPPKTELDFLLENDFKRDVENKPRMKMNLVSWFDEASSAPSPYRSLEPPPTLNQPPNQHLDDMSSINNYIKSKWKSYFGDLTLPLSGRSGWPSRYASQTIVPTCNTNAWSSSNNIISQQLPDNNNITKKIENIRSWLNETQELTESIAE